MQATQLYDQLEKDFIKTGITDDWSRFMQPVWDFLTENYKTRSMGLVCDNAREVNFVYTAVFPTPAAMQVILDRKVSDAMLFVHHPEIWDIRQTPRTFHNMDAGLLHQFKKQGISIYNLHLPLDNYSRYSTGVSLANQLGLKVERPFFNYSGALAAVIARTQLTTTGQLNQTFSRATGHPTGLYQYGNELIENGMVALAAGGGGIPEILKEAAAAGINTYITGVSLRNQSSEPFHRFAQEHKINILGGTHYSTEKPACQAMVGYFQDLGLKSEFVEGEPLLGDL